MELTRKVSPVSTLTAQSSIPDTTIKLIQRLVSSCMLEVGIEVSRQNKSAIVRNTQPMNMLPHRMMHRITLQIAPTRYLSRRMMKETMWLKLLRRSQLISSLNKVRSSTLSTQLRTSRRQVSMCNKTQQQHLSTREASSLISPCKVSYYKLHLEPTQMLTILAIKLSHSRVTSQRSTPMNTNLTSSQAPISTRGRQGLPAKTRTRFTW